VTDAEIEARERRPSPSASGAGGGGSRKKARWLKARQPRHTPRLSRLRLEPQSLSAPLSCRCRLSLTP